MKGSKTLLSYLLFMIGLQWKTVYALASTGCKEGEFMCTNKECIDANWKCDGENDCGDNSDEQNCQFTRQKKCDAFRCANGKCVPHSWTCDTSNDCGDGSDETSDVYPYCLITDKCPKDSFKCVVGGQCIRNTFRCDGVKNCDDGSDEEHCESHICNDDQFQCANKKCISKEWHCDKNNDCGDASDETNCTLSTCAVNEFQCKTSKHCIRSIYRCDGDADCIDHSDENDCTKSTTTEFFSTSSSTLPTSIPPSPKADKQVSSSKTSSSTTSKVLSTLSESSTTPARKCNSLVWFTCPSNKLCVHKSWLCDGASDCPEGEDESDEVCTARTCRDDEFRCDNGKCIDGHRRCNENKECPDGSDEKNCTAIPIACTKETHLCEGTNETCVHHSVLCNGKKDCPLGDDESAFCGVNECSFNNGGCDHNCTDLVLGFECFCSRGYRLAPDLKMCIDIDECKVPGTCTQVCNNHKGGFACDCNKGYQLDPIGKRICRANDPVPFLIFTNSYDIREVSTNDIYYNTVVPKTRDASAVSVDVKNNMIYWLDIANKTIARAKRNAAGHHFTEHVIKNVKKPESLAVDWVGQKLYWIDTYENRLSVSNLDGKHEKTFVQGRNEDQLRALTVYPEKGLIYWTSWGDKPKIVRAHLDGSNQSTVVDENDVTEPVSITIDNTLERLYWSDMRRRHICSSKLDGSDIQIIVKGLSAPYGLAVFEEFVYWTDWYMETLSKANKFNGAYVVEFKKKIFKPKGIAIFHPLAQTEVSHPCQVGNGGCSHLCFVNPSTKYTCSCPDFMTLDSSGKMCISLSGVGPTATEKKNMSGVAITTYVYIAVPCVLVLLLVILLIIIYRRKRSRFDLRMVYETRTELLHSKSGEAEIEVKYVQSGKQQKCVKNSDKNFENVNFRPDSKLLQMNDIESQCMLDHLDNSSLTEMNYDDTRPII